MNLLLDGVLAEQFPHPSLLYTAGENVFLMQTRFED